VYGARLPEAVLKFSYKYHVVADRSAVTCTVRCPTVLTPAASRCGTNHRKG
jgi:hypothetical protein